jgi:hypothetical protein
MQHRLHMPSAHLSLMPCRLRPFPQCSPSPSPAPPPLPLLQWRCESCKFNQNPGVEPLCLVCSGRRPILEADPVKLSSVLVDDCMETVVDCARATMGRGFTEVSSSHPILKGEKSQVGTDSLPWDACAPRPPSYLARTRPCVPTTAGTPACVRNHTLPCVLEARTPILTTQRSSAQGGLRECMGVWCGVRAERGVHPRGGWAVGVVRRPVRPGDSPG